MSALSFKKYSYIIGVDEAGRGPLAGPVSVGAVLFTPFEYGRYKKASHRLARGKDSKQLREEARELWFEYINTSQSENKLRYTVSFTTARKIDRIGIERAVFLAVERTLFKLKVDPGKCLVLLDGRLSAPEKFIYQKTIIRGDEKESIISLASVVAKVVRDRHMRRQAKQFPLYNFGQHKGYGTTGHYTALKKYGPCNIHRLCYLGN